MENTGKGGGKDAVMLRSKASRCGDALALSAAQGGDPSPPAASHPSIPSHRAVSCNPSWDQRHLVWEQIRTGGDIQNHAIPPPPQKRDLSSSTGRFSPAKRARNIEAAVTRQQSVDTSDEKEMRKSVQLGDI